MSKLITAVRNNPKKTIFFSGLAYLGYKLANAKISDNALMQAYCAEALKYGNQPHLSLESERHVTVFLNPAANNGKGKENYEKYCAPLLHLAGLKVALVRTEHEGQARDLMHIMENTNAVVVAGGDGTLAETVTGLMRREDAQTAAKRLPIGILPLGETNTAGSSLWGFVSQPDVKHLAESTMAIIKNIQRPLDIMEIQQIEGNDGLAKSVFAISQIEWGAFRDARERKSVYWYWAFLKKYATYVFSSYKDLSWNFSCHVEYSPTCSGCSNCRAQEIQLAEALKAQQAKQRRWWHSSFMNRKGAMAREEEVPIDFSKIVNEECSKSLELDLQDISDLRLSTCNTTGTKQMPGYTLNLRTGKKDIGTMEFIKEGWQREKSGRLSHANELLVGQVVIIPAENAKIDKKGKEREFSIDNEAYEVRAMRILPRPKAVIVFAPLENLPVST